MTDLKVPNGELATQAWLAAASDIPESCIAGSLPKPEKWANGGFVQIRSLPGGPVNADLPHLRTTVTQVDCWGTRTTNDVFRPLWGVAMDLAERIRVATFPDGQSYGQTLEVPGDGYRPVRALSAWLVGEPIRVEQDPSGYARMMLNLALSWTV